MSQAAGRVLNIFITGAAGEPMQAVNEVRAIAGVGLEGDRYAKGIGSWAERLDRGRRDLTVFPIEGLEEMAADGISIEPHEARRNVLTSGIDLPALEGRQFRIGEVICYGIRRCHPCIYLEHLTKPGVLKAYMNRGGLFTEILTNGTIRVGDPVEALDPADEVSRTVPVPAGGSVKTGA